MASKPPDSESPVPDRFDADAAEKLANTWQRAPVAAVAIAYISGILVDRATVLSITIWFVAAACSLLIAIIVRRRRGRYATFVLLIACVAVGGARHHLSWSTIAADDISQIVDANPQPIRLVGIITSPVSIVASDDSPMTPSWMRFERSMCNVMCEAIVEGLSRTTATGHARLVVTGHLLHAGVGDRVEVVGQLIHPRGATNPGAFDYREHLRRQGIRCLVDCNHPEAVRRLDPHVVTSLSRWRVSLRDNCESILVENLSRRHVPLAVSLLLGERSQLPDDVRDAFAASGTLHLLAISGLHVGILAGLLLIGCRLLNLSVTSTTIVVLLGVGSYAFVTNLRPPVIRAAVLAVVAVAGWPSYRRIGALNVLAVCAIVVLMINPSDLFDTGTQLSFLAVMAIGWAAIFVSRQRSRIDTESLLPRLLSRRKGIWPTLVRLLVEGYVVTTAIWIFTLPLTAARFHIAAPVGFVINVLLIPYVAVLLALGFATLFFGLLIPWLVVLPAMLFDSSLWTLMEVVDGASALHVGHVYLAGPAGWWLILFYGLLGAGLLLRRIGPVGRWCWPAVWSWIIIGQLAAFPIPSRENLRCTFLDVGHGCSVLIELPGGETLLYDAGMFSDGRRGRKIIESVLWEREVRQVDGIIVSHADVDHFNAVVGLMQTVPVGTLLCHRSFLDFDQSTVDHLCDAAGQHDVPIRLVSQRDQIRTRDARVDVECIHPADDWNSNSDNANSLVLRIHFAGRTILLTGDLEGAGLTQLLEQPSAAVDVMLAPHHGSVNANTRALANWAQPRYVIVSSGGQHAGDHLQTIYGSAEDVVQTHDVGAVTVTMTPVGEIRVDTFRTPTAVRSAAVH